MAPNRPDHNPRLLAIKSSEDLQRELSAIGINPGKGEAPDCKGFDYYLKVEKADRGIVHFLCARADALGGNVIINEKHLQDKENTDALLVGNASFFATLASQTAGCPTKAQGLTKELKAVAASLCERNCFVVEWNGRKIDFSSRTYIMGIVNVTPDSFADGGIWFDRKKAVAHALAMVEDGVDIIDVGGESTRPGAAPVDMKEELRRVIPVIQGILNEVNAFVSIDTTKAGVAEAALSEGAEMINDVSALRFDPALGAVAAKKKAPIVLMHMQGSPQTMQKNIHYNDLISEIMQFLRERVKFAEQCGIEPNRIIIDPGIGFGKSIKRDNFTILRNFQEFRSLGRPVLIGPSRKAFLGHLLNLPVTERDDATAAAVAVAIMNGAHIVRVHDVKKMKRVARVVDTIKQSEPLYGAEREN